MPEVFTYAGRDLEAMSFAKRYHAWILDIFRPYLGARVAEVGAGTGSFTELLRKEPVHELIAVEPSERMFDQLRAGLADDRRVTTHCGFFKDVAQRYAGHLDSIVYVNVLEHVERDVDEMRVAYDALRPGGHACIFVPALPFLYSAVDREVGHFRRYTREGLRRAVEGAGFSVVRLGYFDIAGIVPWFVAMKLLKHKGSPGSVGLYDAVVVPIMSRLEKAIRPPIGKNLYVVARKPTA